MQDPNLPSIFFNNGTSSFEFQALSDSSFLPDSREIVDHFLKELNGLPMPKAFNLKLTWSLLAVLTCISLLFVPRSWIKLPCILFIIASVVLWAKPGIVNWGYKRTLLQLVKKKKKNLARFYAIKICKLEMGVSRLDFLVQLLPKKEIKSLSTQDDSELEIVVKS